MVESTTEADLLHQAARGDEAAFVVLYERHRTSVFRFACRMLGSSTQAEDIAQECFLSLLKRPDAYQPERASLRTYLCGTARHLALRALRRRGVEMLEDDGAPEAAAPKAEEPLGRLLLEESGEAVRQAVAALPPLQREAVILFEYEDLSLAEVAAVTESDVGTIKSRLHRARERLRRSLGPWFAANDVASGKEQIA